MELIAIRSKYSGCLLKSAIVNINLYFAWSFSGSERYCEWASVLFSNKLYGASESSLYARGSLRALWTYEYSASLQWAPLNSQDMHTILFRLTNIEAFSTIKFLLKTYNMPAYNILREKIRYCLHHNHACFFINFQFMKFMSETRLKIDLACAATSRHIRSYKHTRLIWNCFLI